MLSLLIVLGCNDIRRALVDVYPTVYAVPSASLAGTLDGQDAGRAVLAVRLVPVASGFSQPTDLQFLPGSSTELVVLEKEGLAWLVDLASGERRRILSKDVLTQSEMGLLGWAFHPDWPKTRAVVINHNVDAGRASRASSRCASTTPGTRWVRP